MFITKKLAEEIAREIKVIIPFYFNIMDEAGVILTCTDEARVGSKHSGTVLMLERNLNELIVERENQYAGCTRGVLFSIRFASNIVGFIGIRGAAEEIMDYGRIIQKMMELLVLEKFEFFRQETDDNDRKMLVNQLVTGISSDNMFEVKRELAKKGIDSKGIFTVAVLHYLSPPGSDADNELKDMNKTIAQRYAINYLSSNDILVSDNKEQCVVIANYSKSLLHQRLHELLRHIEAQYQIKMVGAISNETKGHMGIPDAFHQAVTTLRFMKNKGAEGLHYYDPANIDFLIKQLPEIHKENLYGQIFSECTEEEIQEFRDFIVAYMDCEGSLKLLSEKYFLHKNTIQYKIKRIQKKTGWDIRNQKELMLLYIALQ